MNDSKPVDPNAKSDTDLNAAADALAEASESLASSDELSRLRGELSLAQDAALRAQAELENFRKRMRREIDDERKYAEQRLLADLLPVLDNIGRAIVAAEKAADVGAVVEGFKLVGQQLEGVLTLHQCRQIEALHQPFDPHLHTAILEQPSADHPAGTVLLVAQQGYQLFDRVVRPAQVIVSK